MGTNKILMLKGDNLCQGDRLIRYEGNDVRFELPKLASQDEVLNIDHGTCSNANCLDT